VSALAGDRVAAGASRGALSVPGGGRGGGGGGCRGLSRPGRVVGACVGGGRGVFVGRIGGGGAHFVGAWAVGVEGG